MLRTQQKKKVVYINLGNFGSTGTIVAGISKLAQKNGFKTYCAYPENMDNMPSADDDIVIIRERYLRLCKKLSLITGFNGCFAIIPTIWFLTKLVFIKPDIVHLHNLHNSYINMPLLFSFLRRKQIRTVWTLHDCWAITGHCPHFSMIGCEKWKTGCGNCPQPDVYPRMKKDRSREVWHLKNKWFSGLNDLTIVTPSQWLADLVKQSFLSVYPVKVINNGIDLSTFRPVPSDIKKEFGIENKKMILGVAFDWGVRKGLDIFIALVQKLPSDYQIVLIGTDEKIDTLLPSNMITIHKTKNKEELAKWYTAADVFVNPTREDNFPTVNIESMACGTPVITFRTGGSPEMLDDKTGVVLESEDVDKLAETIIGLCRKNSSEACIKKAHEYTMEKMYNAYLELYR